MCWIPFTETKQKLNIHSTGNTTSETWSWLGPSKCWPRDSRISVWGPEALHSLPCREIKNYKRSPIITKLSLYEHCTSYHNKTLSLRMQKSPIKADRAEIKTDLTQSGEEYFLCIVGKTQPWWRLWALYVIHKLNKLFAPAQTTSNTNL